MIKVGILSMQRIANYGSFLQAYGLKSILEELGCEVQFVDHHPGETLVPSKEGVGIKRKVSKLLEVLKYNAPLKEKLRFVKYKKNYAANYYPYLGISSDMNYSPNLDLLVIGSDEVFNCVQSNTNVGFAPELFGEGNNAKRVITYAASFGNTTEEKLHEYKVDNMVSEWLKKMDAISVRDKNSANIVETIAGVTPKTHLDPVLAYDFINKCEYIPSSVPEENYMVLYGYSGRFSKSECKAIKTFAKEHNLKVLCIGGVQDICDKFIDCNPFEVIAYFQHADYVVTDTFHGTIISIITHKQFATFVRKSGYGNHQKVEDLLHRLNLTDRKVEKIDDFDKILMSSVEYLKTDVLIETGREQSYEYLRKEFVRCTQN